MEKCWLCPKSFSNKSDLVAHLISRDHRRQSVICPWCGEGKTFTRVLDLAVHCGNRHFVEINTLPKSFLTARNCFYFALYPHDFAKIHTPESWSSSNAIESRRLILKMVEGLKDSHVKRDNWRAGWRVASKRHNEEEKENTGVTQSKEKSGTIDKEVMDESKAEKEHHPKETKKLQPIENKKQQSSNEEEIQEKSELTKYVEQGSDKEKIGKKETKTAKSVNTGVGPLDLSLKAAVVKAKLKDSKSIKRRTSENGSNNAKVRKVSYKEDKQDKEIKENVAKYDVTKKSKEVLAKVVESGKSDIKVSEKEVSEKNVDCDKCEKKCEGGEMSDENRKDDEVVESVLKVSDKGEAFEKVEGLSETSAEENFGLFSDEEDENETLTATKFILKEMNEEDKGELKIIKDVLKQSQPTNKIQDKPEKRKIEWKQSDDGVMRKVIISEKVEVSESEPEGSYREKKNVLGCAEVNKTDKERLMENEKKVDPTETETGTETVVHSSFEEVGYMEKATNLLKTGAMPLVPPGRRDWKGEGSFHIDIYGCSFTWPPSGWQRMTPDRTLMAWEHTAFQLEYLQEGEMSPTMSRSFLLDKYNFLALPGSGKVRKEENEEGAAKARYYMYQMLREIALGKDASEAEKCQIDTLCIVRKEGELQRQLVNMEIPLRLN